jgi:ParB family transcriptional regulator, chromosome partitioning protein
MEVIEKKLEEIKPYEKNPRKNEDAVQYVAASIQEFGFKVPIVIDRNGVIVAGHTRYKAAQQLGMESVPCVVADDLSDEQIKAFRLADNKTAEMAGWDFEMLDIELADILDIDMGEFGFVVSDDRMLDSFFDNDAPTPQKVKTQYIVQTVCDTESDAQSAKALLEEAGYKAVFK